MNIIALCKSLRDIKLDELDDDVYLYILKTVNAELPPESHIRSDMDGVALNEHYQNLPPQLKMSLLDIDVINGHAGDFIESVQRVSADRITKQVLEDSSKGAVMTGVGITGTVLTLIAVLLYIITTNLRGEVPDSMVLNFLKDLITVFVNASAPAGE